jgi:biopolymer transport protein TolR
MGVKLSPRQRSYIRKRAHAGEVDASEIVGELNIIPFLDIVVNLIMFLLATSEFVLLISQIPSDLPHISRGATKSKQDVATPLNLNVTVTDAGVLVSGSGGKLSPGCVNLDPAGSRSVTVARKGASYDWPALTECVVKIKSQFADEDTVTVSADPQVQYEHVVAAMDAVRSKGDKELFPNVMVSVGIR